MQSGALGYITVKKMFVQYQTQPTYTSMYTAVNKCLHHMTNMLFFRCRAHGGEGLCCALHVSESLCSGVRQRSPCSGVARCRPQPAGSHRGGSSDLLQPHCGTNGSLDF